MTKLSDVIKTLNELLKQKGDLPVLAIDEYGKERPDVAIVQTSTCEHGEVVIITSGPQM